MEEEVDKGCKLLDADMKVDRQLEKTGTSKSAKRGNVTSGTLEPGRRL